jgi:apolipoprotein N-acyltransferase
VPLLLATENRGAAANFRAFFCFSWVSYLLILYWIPRVMVTYGDTSWFLGIVGLVCLAAFFSLLAGLAGVLIGRVTAAGPGAQAILWIPAIWVAKDLVVERIISGFPWCLVGYSQQGGTGFIQWAELGGIHLVSYLVIAANVLFYRLLKRRDRTTLLALAAYFVVVHAGGFWLLQRSDRRVVAAPLHTAGIIQPNSNHDLEFDFARTQATLERLFRESRELRRAGAEFIVWPEFTVPIYPTRTPFFGERFEAFARDHAPLLAGFTDPRGSAGVFNSVLLFTATGMRTYDKVHLTPFGEYVLFRRWLFFVKKITDEIGDFTPGARIHTLELDGHQLATPVCYEVIYPELVRAMIAQGGEVIVTISNDSWFGRSAAPYQHLAMACCRAIENRRYMLRSTSDGISALVDPGGRILRRSPLQRPDRFLAQFRYLRGRTLFNRWGYLFPYACLALVLGKFLWLGLRRRRYQP